MITAMTTITELLALTLLFIAFVGLVAYARRDHFAGGHNRVAFHDELGHAEPARLAY
jgi:hypothetical protein